MVRFMLERPGLGSPVQAKEFDSFSPQVTDARFVNRGIVPW